MSETTQRAAIAPAVITPEDITRFWSKVDVRGPDDCWPWTKGQHDFGYGQFWLSAAGRNVSAHRVAATLASGEPPLGMHVLHSCDNPPCCNPAHLFLGTHAENMAERDARGRGAKGERQHLARLTADLVRAMRVAYATGIGTPELEAPLPGVHTSTAHSVVTRKTWRHI